MNNRVFQFLLYGVFALATPVLAQDSVVSLAGQPQVTGAANGSGANALFNDPAAIVADANGNFFVADSLNHAIRKVTSSGVVSTFAGQLGVSGSANGSGTSARFNLPSGLAFDQAGNLFVTDTANNTIRKITSSGNVTTIAGIAGQSGFANGPSSSALFNSPLGIAVAGNGTVFIADSGNHVIRAIAGGNVSTFAGMAGVWGALDATGTNAQFNTPCGLAFDVSGNLFVSDANNHVIRKITASGVVKTFAGAPGADGNTDGDPQSARFCQPAELAFDQKGNLFVTDSFSHVIRKITTNGMVSTVSGVVGIFGSNDGANGQGHYYNPYGLALAHDGSLVVADSYNEMIRVVIVPFSVVLQKSKNTATVTWDGVIGKTYQVQYKDGVRSTWLNLSAPVTATAIANSQTDPAAGLATQRYYRVIIQ